MKRITPFHFTNLPKVSPERVKLSASMSSCLPGIRWEETFRDLLGGTLRKYIKGKRQLNLTFQVSSDETEELWEKNFVAGEKDFILIGRNSACEIHLNNRVVSSQHARIVANKTGFFLIDQSANGTYLNGRQIAPKTPTPLSQGDLIGIYPFQIVFGLNQTLSNEDTHIGFKIESVLETSFSDTIKKLNSPVPLAVIGVEPSGRKALLEVDPNFIINMVDQIFGSESSSNSKLLRNLSNIETGVIEFLILRVIKAISDTMAEFSGITIRLEQLFIQGGQVFKTIDTLADSSEPILELCTRVSVGEALGYLNLYLPYGLLNDATKAEVNDQNKLELLMDWLPHLEMLKIKLIAEIGEINLTSLDLYSLEPSDIILLPDVNLKFYGSELSGELFVRLGIWGEVGFRGEIITEDSKLKVILNSVCNNPRPHSPENINKDNKASEDKIEEMEEEDLSQSAEFIQSVPVTVVVELGRRNLTISDVTRLRIGQIIELNRTPSEPVELSVDGKIIGKGELVDVDGELGVRILRLFK
ncbi:MAG: FliM/FliN family flagellar motor switch protein [Acidobacteria bacterium]|nr:FliM/FliN family flagellar motor switch protein [Acidobacteriota bacterium]